MTIRQQKIIPRIITSILMSFGNPNYSVIAGKVLTESRNRSSISRFFSTIKFNPDKILFSALMIILSSFTKQRKGVWFLVIDGTSTRRGGFAKIENAIKYREKKNNDKSGYPSTKAHMFLMGILLSPDGSRFPLPAMPYYTKEYCKKYRMKFKTQVELAVQMIHEMPVPPNMNKLCVLADEYFEGKTVHNACTEMGYSYIIPADSRRCLSDKQGNRTAVTLHKRRYNLNRKNLFKKIFLVEGQEKTTAYRRLSEPGRKTKREYSAHTENVTVAGLGSVCVTYSWKQKKKKGNKTDGATYKVLITNDDTLSCKDILEYYELRWQIEIFFREMKSVLGFDKFRGNSFTAYARFVSIALLSILFLEWYRNSTLRKTRSKQMVGDIAKARTLTLINLLNKKIEEENIEHILYCFADKQHHSDGAAMLKKLLRIA
ncbi:MAG: transposase [Mariniphaga sp.]|nr:transposase [Mariniphaga sp.]